ncbi:MAG TPA: serine hydrolase domain-containing protein [Gemmatimonadaceae bacterium]|jgi:CubicO group peptidase (beta-lactamase class C family)
MIRRIALVTTLVATSATAQVPFDSASRWVDSMLVPYAAGRTPGCVVGVTRDGSLALAKAYGLADVARDVPLTSSTRFYVASLSKQFTAMSVVLLVQDGKLSLDDTITKWVPELPSFAKAITIRHLLNHTSGLRDYMTLLAVSGWPSDGELTEKQFLALMHRQKTLNFAPGDEFLYSNTGYALMSVIIKRASGQSLRDFAAKRIFAPLGMTSTEFRDDHHETIPNRAIGYEVTEAGLVETNPRIDVVGDAGVYSTLDDLAKWEANFGDPRVGGAAGIAMMMEPGRLNNGQQIPYGLALTLGEMRGMKTIAHSGAFGGYRTEMLRFPEVDIGVVTLCNTSMVSASLAEQIATLVMGVTPRRLAGMTLPFELSTSPYATGAFAVPADSTGGTRRRNDQLAQMAGNYYSEELDLGVSLAARDGALYLRRPKAVDVRFGSFATDLFTSSDKMLLRVVRDSHGAVSGFTLTINRVRDLAFVRREPDKSTHTP